MDLFLSLATELRPREAATGKTLAREMVREDGWVLVLGMRLSVQGRRRGEGEGALASPPRMAVICSSTLATPGPAPKGAEYSTDENVR